ncbi:MAG: DUF1349 domain-containing protein, partial [Chloroflexota bacterium]
TVTPTEAPITEVDDATDTPTPDLALPLLWSATDIGAVGIAGSSAFVDNRFVIRGAGTDIWREGNILNDEFYFVYQQMSGDAEFVARITDATHVHEWTKAGIMIRETLQVGSDYVLLADTRDHNTAMQWGFDSSIHDIQQVETPYWLRLTRIGNTFTGYMSTDGNNWMQISQANVEMDQVVSVGLFVTSHDNSQLASASFDNVVVQAIQDNTPSATSVSSSTATYTPTTQPIILIPTQTPLPTIRTCPAGVGPNGITAGDYPPGKLYQNERQWLFAAFGHSGTAPIGYGGEHCGTRVQDASVNFNRWICSNNWEGPGGLELGSYPAGRLTQSQRQWLYESFRNEGTASVGYGGEFCPGDYTSSTQNFFAWVCSQDLTGPEGVVPGSYDAGNLSFSQRQWLWDVFVEAPGETVPVGYGGQHCPGQNGNYDENYIRRARVCSSGATGPYGMIPGNYNVDDLTYEERAWLYDIFENTGDVPVGYGGEPCPDQTANYAPPDRTGSYNPTLPMCPDGVGEPGSYETHSLTQQQRNELWNAFGHSGEAPVGYGGEQCQGGTMTLHSFASIQAPNESSNPPEDEEEELDDGEDEVGSEPTINLGRNCTIDESELTVTCYAVAVTSDSNPLTLSFDPHIGVFELPDDGSIARIESVTFSGSLGQVITADADCGSTYGQLKDNSTNREISPNAGFILVQGCVSGIEFVSDQQNPDYLINWSLTYRIE